MMLLTTDELSVNDGAATLLQPISLHLDAGEPLVVLGETGSGKSLLAQAIMGTLSPELSAQGTVAIGNRMLNSTDRASFSGLWGRDIAVLPQEPWLSLDPLMRARAQVREAHQLVRGLSSARSAERARADLNALGLADAPAARFPHELSGGMAQRVAIAAARAGGARIVIADEPTKGLDASLRDEVAELLLGELSQGGALLVITHDLALARRIGGRLMVLRAGEVVETGATTQVFEAPSAAYTRQLIAADPKTWTPRAATTGSGKPVVQASELAVQRGGLTLFNGINLAVKPGQILGVTGPSGCGKSTLGDALLGLVEPQAGRVDRAEGLPVTSFQKLYQDPVAAFPRLRRIGQTIDDVARRHDVPGADIAPLMDRLGLDPVLLRRRPDAVSGGELQRLSLLRILLTKPRFIVADEPTSRLDPITQAQVVQMLADLPTQGECALLLISHDAALVRNTADSVFCVEGADSRL